MAQKSNPISLRLRKTNKLWNSCWYGDYNYTTQLLQDRAISAYIQNICQQAKMAPPVVFVHRQRQQTSTFLFFPRQQRISRIKRPSRGEFRKTARGGYDWLHKLLFWSCKVSVLASGAVNNNVFPQLPFSLSNCTPMEKRFNLSPLLSSSKFLNLFPYLLFSKTAAHNCQDYAPDKWSEMVPLPPVGENSRPIFHHNSRPQAGWKSTPAAHTEEIARKGESPHPLDTAAPFILYVLGKWKSTTPVYPPSHQGGETAEPRRGARPFHFEKTVQQGWGFFAMRNQYSTGGKISASPSYLGRLARPPFSGRVQPGRLVNPVKRSHPTPWRNHLESCISAKTLGNETLYFLLCPSIHQNPYFLASQLCFSLENRKTFRRLKDRLMQDISADSSIKGVRITCSGRVAARSKKAQKAKTESIQWGQTSLNVFSDLVNFASKSALTPFGKIGVKVWICSRGIKKSGGAVRSTPQHPA